MSYENTSCPCGEKKLTDTMLCAACETVVAGSYDRKAMDDHREPFELRRHAAMRVLAPSKIEGPVKVVAAVATGSEWVSAPRLIEQWDTRVREMRGEQARAERNGNPKYAAWCEGRADAFETAVLQFEAYCKQEGIPR